MRQKTCLLLILLLLLLFLSGCWSRRELNDLSIVVGLGIDKEDDHYVVTTQVVNPGEISAQQTSGTKAPVIAFKQKAKTVLEAVRKITTVSPRKQYFPHLQVVVLGTKAAEEGVGEIVDFLSRDHEFRTDFFVVVAKNEKAESVLEVLTGLEYIPANKIFESLKASEEVWASTMTVTLDQLIRDIVNKGTQANLTGIELLGDQDMGNGISNVNRVDPAAILQYSGMAALKDDRLIGWFSEQESKGLNYALGKVQSTVLSVPCTEDEEKSVEIELTRTKSEVTVKLRNNQTKGIIEIQAEGNVSNVGCKEVDLTNKEIIPYIEEKTEQNIKDSIEAAVKKSQEEFKADYFGFGEALHRSNPDFWNKVKDDWDEIFKDMTIEINVDVKILKTGTIGDSHF